MRSPARPLATAARSRPRSSRDQRSQGKSITAIRIENTPQSIVYRRDKLADLLKPYGSMHDLDNDHSHRLLGRNPRARVFSAQFDQRRSGASRPRRRSGPKVVAAIQRYMDCRAFYDWSGGLVWLETPPTADAGAADIRRVVATHGGHATLIRAEAGVRAAVDVFQPQEPGALRLMRQLKAAFDPAGILNPGRMTQRLLIQRFCAKAMHSMQTNFTAEQLKSAAARRGRQDPAALRALRAVHRDLLDLCAARRRTRQPARPHLSDEGHVRAGVEAARQKCSTTSTAACRACRA